MTEAVTIRNQSIDLLPKSMDWFLYDNGLRHERVNIRSEIWTRSLSKKIKVKMKLLETVSLVNLPIKTPE